MSKPTDKARCPKCGATWTFSEEDMRVLKECGALLSGVEEQLFLCTDCSTARTLTAERARIGVDVTVER